MKRLDLDTWENIFRNLADLEADGEDVEVEVIWLDDTPEGEPAWVLASGCELFEDGFYTELEAYRRIEEVHKLLSERA